MKRHWGEMQSTIDNYAVKFGEANTLQSGRRWMDACVKFANSAYQDGLAHFQCTTQALKEFCTKIEYICVFHRLIIYLTPDSPTLNIWHNAEQQAFEESCEVYWTQNIGDDAGDPAERNKSIDGLSEVLENYFIEPPTLNPNPWQDSM